MGSPAPGRGGPALAAGLALAMAACGSEPVPTPGAAPASAPPARSAPRPATVDPHEAGIGDLARASRYVYAEMQRHAECGFGESAGMPLQYAVEVEVSDGRFARAELGEVAALAGSVPLPLSQEHWPAVLTERVACLAPHLRALRPDPPPADGVYRARFTAPGPGAAPVVPPAAPASDAPDPAEPGLPDLPRVARYVFREMRAADSPCALAPAPVPRLSYALEVEVRNARIARLVLTSVEEHPGGRVLDRSAWPSSLEEYATCLAARLTRLPLDPAPADGTYLPTYLTPG